MYIRRLVPFAAVALATSLVAGCGNSTEEDDGSRLTIASLMGQDTDYSPDHYQAQEAQIQDLVAQCMRQEGWEYIPVEYPEMGFEYTEGDELERLQREGFGISYWTLNQGNEDLAENDPFADWVDPNQAIVAAMDEGEMTAYYESLYGTQAEQEENMTVEVDPDTGEEYYMQTGYGPGCQGEAYEEVYGNGSMQSEDYWNAMSVFYEELYSRIEADPRFKALDSEYSTCMAKQGYDLKSPNDLWETLVADLQSRHDEIVGDVFSRDPFEGWTESDINAFYESATQEEMDAIWQDMYTITDEQRTALEALLADEIKLAVDENSCSGPYWKDYQDISAQVEEEYAIEHRAELEELALSLGMTE